VAAEALLAKAAASAATNDAESPAAAIAGAAFEGLA
jgi:hypothetical protein